MADVGFGLMFFTTLALGIVCGCYAYFLAQAKGLAAGSWFWGGFFFTFVALIALAGTPSRK